MSEHQSRTVVEKITRLGRIAWLSLFFVFEHFIGSLMANWGVIRKEADLFFGTAVTIVGMLGFSAGRYCDGNTAEYLSCTRPSSFYYFDALHITLVIIGVFYIALWFRKGAGVHNR